MNKIKKLVIVGDSAFAEVAHEYFDIDSDYEVVAFAVERDFLKRNEMRGLPIVPFEELETHFPPGTHEVYVATVYTQLNRLRTRLAAAAKLKGYQLASYVSSRAFVWHNVQLGEHCFIFEDNTIQPFVTIGNNVVMWSGNHIGHHSVIHDNCFLASHVVVSGFCNIGRNTFMGVNATLANNVTIGEDNWIGLGVTIVRNTAPNQLFKGEQPEPAKISALRFFKVKE
ncbi:acetyltransferase [Methylobacter sp. S3L5C]|uniref:acetyltransferase n=1 Tax=Methylobacter sp. S3L5C TaxID=2839024 RepID=UPI001FABDB66|nr:acetyltransferase [Methylobacter sp. S3L5C]UOA09534.1 acetyltransferase [Methylobacter sp. S3L5C]